MTKGILFTRCGHLAIIGGNVIQNEIIQAEIRHEYCPHCSEEYEKMMKDTQMAMDKMFAEWEINDEGYN